MTYIFKQNIGTRAQVMHGTAKMTGGRLTKKNLKYNKRGKIVSKKASKLAKKNNRLVKAGYITKKGHFGSFMIGGMEFESNSNDNLGGMELESNSNSNSNDNLDGVYTYSNEGYNAQQKTPVLNTPARPHLNKEYTVRKGILNPTFNKYFSFITRENINEERYIRLLKFIVNKSNLYNILEGIIKKNKNIMTDLRNIKKLDSFLEKIDSYISNSEYKYPPDLVEKIYNLIIFLAPFNILAGQYYTTFISLKWVGLIDFSFGPSKTIDSILDKLKRKIILKKLNKKKLTIINIINIIKNFKDLSRGITSIDIQYYFNFINDMTKNVNYKNDYKLSGGNKFNLTEGVFLQNLLKINKDFKIIQIIPVRNEIEEIKNTLYKWNNSGYGDIKIIYNLIFIFKYKYEDAPNNINTSTLTLKYESQILTINMKIAKHYGHLLYNITRNINNPEIDRILININSTQHNKQYTAKDINYIKLKILEIIIYFKATFEIISREDFKEYIGNKKSNKIEMMLLIYNKFKYLFNTTENKGNTNHKRNILEFAKTIFNNVENTNMIKYMNDNLDLINSLL